MSHWKQDTNKRDLCSFFLDFLSAQEYISLQKRGTASVQRCSVLSPFVVIIDNITILSDKQLHDLLEMVVISTFQEFPGISYIPFIVRQGIDCLLKSF